MHSWASIDGVVSPGAEARISIFDRGFLFGDSVYEVLRTVGGRPLHWAEHMDRLWESARRIALEPAVDPDGLRAELEAVLAQTSGESRVRVILTRGLSAGGLGVRGAGAPTRVIACTPLAMPNPALYAQGCSLKIVRTARRDEGGLDPRAKSGNKLMAVMAQAEAENAGCYEALRVDPLGRVLEGGTSTFFMVRDGVLWTPPLGVGILAGITRDKILQLATEGEVTVREDAFHVDDLAQATEAFITSSVRGVMPVAHIDALEFAAPGPVTHHLMQAYATAIGA